MVVGYYFAYGSNMNQGRVTRRSMRFDSLHPGKLQNFRLAFNKRSIKFPGAASANVVEHPGALTEGVLYRLTDPDQITLMDPFEGYPVRYDRLPLAVECDEGLVEAWVYIANFAYVEEGLRPARWYLEHLLAGKPFLSDAYYSALQSVPCLPDTMIEPE